MSDEVLKFYAASMRALGGNPGDDVPNHAWVSAFAVRARIEQEHDREKCSVIARLIVTVLEPWRLGE